MKKEGTPGMVGSYISNNPGGKNLKKEGDWWGSQLILLYYACIHIHTHSLSLSLSLSYLTVYYCKKIDKVGKEINFIGIVNTDTLATCIIQVLENLGRGFRRICMIWVVPITFRNYI